MADGKIFAAEFALRRNVKALDKILIEDSDDGVVKYAFPPQIAALSGYAYANSVADLPEDPVNKTIGYVVGDKFYIYVGEGGNAKDGLYQEVQGFVGPQGIPGPKGDKGDAGDGAIDEAYLANYLQQNQYQTASDVNSALAIYATQAYVTQEIDKLLGGASGAYDTLKEIEEVLKGNVDSIGDLFDVLDTKWTQDNTLIAHWNEAYSWGNHATAGYVAKTYVDSNFVTLATAQTITGEKNFTGGFKVNGGILEYNASLGTWVLNGDLLVTGGVSAFSNIEGFTPSTITDAVLIDNDTIKRNALGELYVASDSGGGGIDEAYLAEYLTANNYAKTSDINSALTDYATQSWVTNKGYITASASITGNAATATKLKNSISLWGRTFDGSADLTGALTVTTGEGYRINYNGYDLRFIVSGSSSNRGIWDNTNNNWLMYRSGSNDIYFTSGNIGFGTTSPTEKVTVSGNVKSTGHFNSTSANSHYHVNGREVIGSYLNTYSLFDSAPTDGYDTHILGSQIYLKGGADKTLAMLITSSGNVDVKGKLTLPTGSSNFTNASLWFGDSVRIGVNSSNSLGIFAGYAIRLNPDSATSASTTKGLWLLNSGYNGVNNSSPTEALDVTGNIKASGVLKLPAVDSGFTNPRIIFGDNICRIGLTTSGLLGIYTSGDVRINPNSVTSTSSIGLWLKTTGYNGINTSSPTQALHVVGKGIFADATNPWISLQRDGVNWYLQVVSTGLKLGRTSALGVLVDDSGNMVAPGGVTATNSSDERLKRNIRKFNAREVLMSLGGVYEYEYLDSEVQKNHIYEGTHYGLIYQHVKGTKLDVMCHEREDGMGALNYIHPKFISLIAGATMENTTEIEKLKRENRELKKRVKQLEQRVA